jgi:hypothetical protein
MSAVDSGPPLDSRFMKKNSEVERWFAEKKLPNEKPIRRLREILLAADPRISDYVKYGSLLFGYEGDLVSVVQVQKKNINLMFNNGAKIPGNFPHLEGNGPNARFMRFADLAEVNARAAELKRIARAWCELKAPRRY